MGRQTVLFFRRYRAALLDYLLGSGETGLARAYDLGRIAVDNGLGPLQILGAHQQAISAVLESSQTVADSLKSVRAAQTFLMESLSPFEMTCRGYMASLAVHGGRRDSPPAARRSHTPDDA